MTIQLQNAGKRYRLDWIFRGLDFSFEESKRYAVLGPNGSGKSTLLKVLSGHLTPSKGKVVFMENGKEVPSEHLYRQISYAAPYIELIEEFTLEEALKFHAGLKPLLPGFTPARLYELLALPRTRAKEIRYFSSGMKQRVKIALAVCSDTPVLLLDEPATNLDTQGVAWYKELIAAHAADRLVVIASNDPHDAEFCPIHLNILDYKKSERL
ncbi:MAG: ABC transporter ATP-binding protein [Lewinellaceae bacterium]|nr:ABC transporter ATP-binding protein [Saprospiraceae bacterium]MCB0542036.1 ABC transporter ATP-binding protein [Saprospiraceae bacterium]MCB9354122.1 ABC transporter ATP-binding protein [Lewinellaceae bacterium]